MLVQVDVRVGEQAGISIYGERGVANSLLRQVSDQVGRPRHTCLRLALTVLRYIHLDIKRLLQCRSTRNQERERCSKAGELHCSCMVKVYE